MNPGRAPTAAIGAAAGLILPAAAAALVKARSYDMWWHLRAGEWILATRSVPRVDDFSFTSAGLPWIDHEWLFQIVLYAASRIGPAGLYLLKAACALLVAVIGYTALRRLGDASRGFALALVALCIAGLRFRLAERPESITLVLAAGFSALALDLAARPGSPARRLALIAGLTIAWANLHAGSLLAPVLALACAAGASLDRLRGTSSRSAAPLWWGVPLSAACLTLNPYGLSIYSVPAGIAQALASAKFVNPEWGRPALWDFPLFYLTLACATFAALRGLRRGADLAAPRLALVLMMALLALSSVRHVGLFFALLPMMVDPGRLAHGGPAPRRWAFAGGAAAILSCIWMLAAPPPGAGIGLGIQPERFPEKGADFVQAHLADARLYNDVAAGGYLIWRGYPVRRVFIDGRNEVHAALLADLAAAMDDGRRWGELLERHGVEGAIVGYRAETIRAVEASTGRPYEGTFSELHFPRERWALVYWDDTTMIFVDRQGRFGALGAEHEYREARPEAWALGRIDQLEGEALERVRVDIARRLEEAPPCRLATEVASAYLKSTR